MIEGLKKERGKKVLPTVENQTLTIRPPHSANIAHVIGYLALQ